NLGAAPADWGHLSICIFWRIEGIFVKIFRLLIPFFSLAVAAAQPSLQPPAALTLPLREGWTVQSSAKVTATGEAISGAAFKTAFNTNDWIQADVPTTVVAAQVKSGLL